MKNFKYLIAGFILAVWCGYLAFSSLNWGKDHDIASVSIVAVALFAVWLLCRPSFAIIATLFVIVVLPLVHILPTGIDVIVGAICTIALAVLYVITRKK